MLARLLREIASQETAGAFTFSVVVTDNDASQSARPVVEEYARGDAFPVMYTTEPERNIAVARNTALSHATGEFIVFIDDDEFPVAGWLLNLFRVCETHQVAGVLGPVKPHFESGAPKWLVKGGFYNRPTHPTGYLMPWQECRTGNVLLRRSIFSTSGVPSYQPSTLNSSGTPATEPAFRREFGTGGEDQDFFRRMSQRGHRFIWCDEAVAYEEVPASRWSRRFLLSRALLRGRNTFRHPKHRARNLLKSAIAVPGYALALPVLLVAGHHYFMRYLVKMTDHVGRLLAAARLNPVRERRM
jgi:glycosyltransferase involved in cell wall biosynthesis